MSGMSIFNSRMPEQSNPVFNMDWSGYARGGDIERASGKVTGSIEKASEKMTGKLSGTIEKEVGRLGNDVQKSTGQIVSVVKDGAEKISDTVKRSAINNANPSPPSAASAVSAGLCSVAESTTKLANHLRSHPNELGAVARSAEAVRKKFDDLIDRTSEFAKSGERLRKTTTEVSQAAGWIGSNYPCGDVAVNNASGFVSDISVFNFR